MSITNYNQWQAAVKKAYPKEALHLLFKRRVEHGHETVSAELPNLDRSYGVWTGPPDNGEGEVLTAKVKSMSATNTFAARAVEAAKPLTPKQEQLDVNEDGKISSDDLKRLREGEKPGEASAFLARANSLVANPSSGLSYRCK